MDGMEILTTVTEKTIQVLKSNKLKDIPEVYFSTD